ncbi:TPA: glycosyl transferase [Candidatus Delongbacteria bacterium]|nr:glycosyl transferase [Candidatus Delongbacteria bacterium]
MSSYNSIEKYFARILAEFPGLKSGIKRLYSTANFYLHKKNFTHKSEKTIIPVLSCKENESFFGYYDKSPMNLNDEFIIYHETGGIHTNLPPDTDKKINIMLFNAKNNSYRKITETSSYNWQQGSKLQWLTEEKLIFNDFDGLKFISKMYDTRNESLKTIDFPIYDCFKDEFALSINFSRLNSTDKDYGYKNIKYKPDHLKDLKNDGIFFVDLKRNKTRLIIPIENIINLHFKENMKEAKHLFNHIMMSPDGKYFIFIHRWYQSGKRYDSLILSSMDGADVKVLADSDLVSHCCWFGNKTVVGYLKYHSHGNSFYKINIQSGKINLLSEKMRSFGDGHPSFYGNKMLFDSYPDRSRMQSIYIYDIEKDIIDNIGSFLSPLRYFSNTRCDLHPRWSFSGKDIFFDSTHEGNRTLNRINYVV